MKDFRFAISDLRLNPMRSSIFQLRSSPLPARRGFSFVELMFAVVLLGIGFIMLAAIFPVGIRQQQETLDADNATAMVNVAHAMVSTGQYLTYTSLPLTGPNPQQVNFVPAALTPIAGSQVNSADPRYAWTVVWKWDSPLPAVPIATPINGTFYYFILRARERETYTPAMGNQGIRPQRVRIERLDYDSLGSIIEFAAPAGSDPGFTAIEAGAFVVIAESTVVPTSVGNIYRVSERVTAGNNARWYLSPDFTAGSIAEELDAADDHFAYVVGKEVTIPTDPWDATANPFVATGRAQDIVVVKKTLTVPTP